MKNFLDLTGLRFGRLVVIERCEDYFPPNKNKPYVQWLCKCDCGRETKALAYALRSGHKKSCGCLRSDLSTKRVVSYNTTHGESGTRLYSIWTGIKGRCNNPHYEAYGGRGIKICPEWDQDFTTFKQWAISHGYDETLTIDRIDVNGNYEPGNCRWVSKSDQHYNKRSNHYLEYDGVSLTISQWARVLGMKPYQISLRLRRGWSIEEALMTPIKEN